MDLPVLRFPPLDVGVWCLGGPSSSSSVALIPSLNDGRVDGSRVVGSSPNSWRRIKTCLNFPPKLLIRVYIGTVPQGFCDSGYCEKSLIVTILAQEYLVRNWNCYSSVKSRGMWRLVIVTLLPFPSCGTISERHCTLIMSCPKQLLFPVFSLFHMRNKLRQHTCIISISASLFVASSSALSRAFNLSTFLATAAFKVWADFELLQALQIDYINLWLILFYFMPEMCYFNVKACSLYADTWFSPTSWRQPLSLHWTPHPSRPPTSCANWACCCLCCFSLLSWYQYWLNIIVRIHSMKHCNGEFPRDIEHTS